MKYSVQIKYTNPSHEHVSLRRRVESVTRLVEAANEQEALNRAANQQRALGFLIKEAEVMKEPKEENLHADEKEKKKKKVVGDDEQETDIASAGGVKEEKGGTESYPLLKKGEKLKPMKLKMGEEIEDIEEGKVAKALALGALALSSMGAHHDAHAQGFSKDYLTSVANGTHPRPMISVDKAKELLQTHHSDSQSSSAETNKPAKSNAPFSKDYLSKVISGEHPRPLISSDKAKELMKQHYNEEFEIDEAKKPLKPSYWKAEWRLGTQSEVDKNNKKLYDKLVKTDPEKAAKFHDSLMKLRKEEVEQVEEGVATAQKVMDRAKVVAKTNPDPKKRFAASGLAQKAMLRTINPTGVNTGITRGGGNKTYRMVTGKVPPYQLTKKTGVSEEVEQIDELKKSTLASYVKGATRDVASASRLQRGYETDAARSEFAPVRRGSELAAKNMRKFAGKRSRGIAKAVDKLAKEEVVTEAEREAGYKMSPAVRKAQAASDALSKREKKPQAGTLAAQKTRKAAEKMVNKAKGKANKINMTPEIEPGKPNNA